MGYPKTNIAAATAAVTNRFLAAGTAMKNGTYAVANSGTMPTGGARHVTVTRAVVGGADTAGKITFTGRNLAGETITEDVVPGANGVTVAGVKWFAFVDGQEGSGWATNTGDDTIQLGCGPEVIVLEGSGTLHSVTVNTTAAGTIVLADGGGTFATIKASVAEGNYEYHAAISGYLQVTVNAASNITVMHSGSQPTSYSM